MKLSNNIKGFEEESKVGKTAEIKVDTTWLDYFVPIDIKLSQKKQITLIFNPEEFKQLQREINKYSDVKKGQTT